MWFLQKAWLSQKRDANVSAVGYSGIQRMQMALQEDRMRENEELFRTANERLRERIKVEVTDDRVVPFLCECADDLCMGRVEMTLADYRNLRADGDTFMVVPGHAFERGEVVVRELSSYHVVRKIA